MSTRSHLAEEFFADCQADGKPPNEENLRSWLWFTCPANMRPEVREAILADPRYKGQKINWP